MQNAVGNNAQAQGMVALLLRKRNYGPSENIVPFLIYSPGV